jgi:hypothetical protein
MSEGEKSRKVRKSGRPKVVGKPEVESPKSESQDIEKEAHSAIGIPHSEIKEISELEHPKSEITMEVHHHPDVEKKGLKEYILEGLMIFLAVTMGFFAESIREHIADHERENQYMESLINDLALDTVAFKSGFPIKEQRIRAIDSVYLFFESHPAPKAITVNVYRNIKRTLWDRIYARNTGTINQLKNAGGLRLVRNREVRDSIVTYDQLWERLDYYKQVYYSHQQQGDDMVENMLNASDLVRYYRVNSTRTDDYSLLPASIAIRINIAGLNSYLNFLNLQKITTIQDEQSYRRLDGKAAALIKQIKKEYDLE